MKKGVGDPKEVAFQRQERDVLVSGNLSHVSLTCLTNRFHMLHVTSLFFLVNFM